MNDKYNSLYDKIKPSKELDEKVFAQTIKKQIISPKPKFVVKKFPKLAYLAIILISVLSLGIGVAFAKEYINKYILNKNFDENGAYQQYIEVTEKLKVNQSDKITCDNISTLSELGEALNVNFAFDVSKYNDKIDSCEINTNVNGKIESVRITMDKFVDFSEYNKQLENAEKYSNNIYDYDRWGFKRLSLVVKFMTTEASPETEEDFSKSARLTGNTPVETHEFYISNLDTTGYWFQFKRFDSRYHVGTFFAKDGIVYAMTVYNVPPTEIVEIVNNF